MDILNKLIEQSKKPSGIIGSIMLVIMNSVHKKLFKWTLTKVHINKNSTILDIGFGGGEFLQLLSCKNKQVKLFGIDISDTSLKLATKKNRKNIESGKISLLINDMEPIPFPDKYFNYSFALQTHYYWNNLPQKVKEIYRVTAEKYKINYHMQNYKTKNELINLFEIAGYREIEYFEIKEYICIVGKR